MKEGIGSFASVSAASGPVGPIHLGNPGSDVDTRNTFRFKLKRAPIGRRLGFERSGIRECRLKTPRNRANVGRNWRTELAGCHFVRGIRADKEQISVDIPHDRKTPDAAHPKSRRYTAGLYFGVNAEACMREHRENER